MGHLISVRSSCDLLKVKLESNGTIVFKGVVPVDDSEKIKSLVASLRAKGVNFPKGEVSWW